MKLVIKLSRAALDQPAILRDFGGQLRQLVADGHGITVVHGCPWPAKRPLKLRDEAFVGCASQLNKRLASALSKCGVAAIGLTGLDANLIRLRKPALAQECACVPDVAAVDPFWLEAISRHNGVPLLGNLAADLADECHLVNTDRLAAACAVSWNADALIILTGIEPLLCQGQPIQRWLNVSDVDALARAGDMPSPVLSKLRACHYALKHHVRRTRLLPLSDLHHLSHFYSARIDSGTEPILDPKHALMSRS